MKCILVDVPKVGNDGYLITVECYMWIVLQPGNRQRFTEESTEGKREISGEKVLVVVEKVC